ncbi:MAG TPA: hypothetical protein VIU12_05455 [Chryseolinea sp.]
MKYVLFYAILLCATAPAMAQTRFNLSAGLLGNHLIVSEVPSYIKVNDYLLYTEGVHIEGKQTPGFMVGVEIQRQIRKWNIYMGAHFAYQQARVTYYNDNLFFYDTQPPFEEHRFAIDIKQNFNMLQIPLGIMIPAYRKFYVDLAFRTNAVLSVKKTEKANDAGFAYQLVSLQRRDVNQFLFEASAGLAYQTSGYTAKVVYSRGLNPLQEKSRNCYNNLIPADLYFSGINLSMGVNMNRLFPFNRK